MSDNASMRGYGGYSLSSFTGEPLVLDSDAALCLSDCLVVLLNTCLAAGVSPDGSQWLCAGDQKAATATRGAMSMRGIYRDRTRDIVRNARPSAASKNGESLLDSRIIDPWNAAGMAWPVHEAAAMANAIATETTEKPE